MQKVNFDDYSLQLKQWSRILIQMLTEFGLRKMSGRRLGTWHGHIMYIEVCIQDQDFLAVKQIYN